MNLIFFSNTEVCNLKSARKKTAIFSALLQRLFYLAIISIIALLLFPSNNAVSQEYPLQFRDSPEYDTRVLVVPFDPRIYYNDATMKIAKKTGKDNHEIMQFFRHEFNKMIVNSLIDSCYVIDLLTDHTRTAQQDITDIYTSIGYQMKTAMQNRPEHPDDVPKESFFRRIFNRKKDKETEKPEVPDTRLQNGQIVSERRSNEGRFVHIYFNDPNFLSELSRQRGIDIFLFINQFEIKGVYEAYMSGNPDSKRNVKVHFSMYDSTGKLVHGSYGNVEIPFYLDDKNEIVNNYFPKLVRQIINNIEFSRIF